MLNEKSDFVVALQIKALYDEIGFQRWRTPMKPSLALQTNRAAIRNVVERHRACNARVFGSVVHGDDHEGSDLDILIDPTPSTTLMDVAKIQVELEKLLGVSVDVLTPKALPDKFRGVVLAEAVAV
jgi:predicted nucleotidyltransferase